MRDRKGFEVDSRASGRVVRRIESYYLGIRYSMPANAAASKVASLQNQRTMGFEEWIKEIGDARTTAEQRTEQQDALRARIDAEFIDINQYMLNLVEENNENTIK